MPERLGLRKRFALFFAALGIGACVAIGLGAWVGLSRSTGAADGFVIAALIGMFGVLGLVAWIGFLFDQNVARPIVALTSDLSTRARTDAGGEIDQSAARYLGALAPAARNLHTALTEARAAGEEQVARKTAAIEREKALFAALLHDLAEGVFVIGPDQRIMLYNRAARDILPGAGLDRPLSGVIRVDPMLHAIERLNHRDPGEGTRPEAFLTASADGARLLIGRVSRVISAGKSVGHVVVFHDATDDLQAHAEHDHIFNDLLEQVRRSAAAMGAILDVLTADPDIELPLRATFDTALHEELQRVYDTLNETAGAYDAATSRHWPMTEVAASDIFDALAARRPEVVAQSGGDAFLHCDGYAVLEILDRIVGGLADDPTRSDFAIGTRTAGDEVWITLDWAGPKVADRALEAWLQVPLSASYGQYSGRDALQGHRTEIWPEETGGRARLVLPLRSAQPQVLKPQEERPEFYDFNLPGADGNRDWMTVPLRALRFVVFDTETTGLNPAGRDEIVQIAGMRIVNGRLLTGEVFDTLVNPGRKIPPASTAVHKIEDTMVVDAPDIGAAGQAFHDFCEGSVLVAHNAPFDMAFLRKSQDRIGARFGQPALCTVLLSAVLFDHTGDHTLDALCDRFGVDLPAELRHTALGDARATAQVFLHMLDLLEARGILTLGDAIAASEQMTQIRKAQNYGT